MRPNHIQNKIAVIVSDSIASYIKSQLEDRDVYIIGGDTSARRYQYFTEHLPSLDSYDKLVVYLWLGTCDLTRKIGPSKGNSITISRNA